MALDFTALNKIAYRVFETREQKDTLTEKGYSIIEGAENPFLQASEPRASSGMTNASGVPKNAAERKTEAFMSASGRDYNAMYRAAHDFHKRHNPPTVDLEYWSTHEAGIDDTPEAEADYWLRIAEDVTATAQAWKDPFLTGLLLDVCDELEREYKRIRNDAHKQASEAV